MACASVFPMRSSILPAFFVAGAFLFVAAEASAHAVLSSPPPRDTTAHKDVAGDPTACGVARTAKFTSLTAGQMLTVNFNETVGHRGCFQIAFSMAGDKNFQLLGQKDDPADGTGARSMTVKIPDVNCTDCTLQLMQLMNDKNGGTPCPPNANPAQATSGTYHSCADIRITGASTGTDAGTSTGTDSGTGPGGGGDDDDDESDGGTGSIDPGNPGGGGGTGGADSGTGNGADPNAPDLRAGEGEGCAIANGASSPFSAAGVAVLFLGMSAIVRRVRRNRR